MITFDSVLSSSYTSCNSLMHLLYSLQQHAAIQCTIKYIIKHSTTTQTTTAATATTTATIVAPAAIRVAPPTTTVTLSTTHIITGFRADKKFEHPGKS